MLTTLQQAKKLKELGYGLTFTAFRYEKSTEDVYNSYDPLIQCQSGDLFIKAPTVSEALDWFREVKGVPCSVHLEFESNNSEWFYYGEWGIKGENKINTTETFDTHSLASSALLDDVMKYVDGRRSNEKV